MPEKPNTALPTRRTFLKTAAKAGVTAASSGPLFNLFVPSAAAAGTPLPPGAASGMNMIVFITDQERDVQWFPNDWVTTNLPAMASLQQNGVTFRRAYTNSAMCTPARNCFFTGRFPAQHRCFDTLTEDFPQSKAEHQLDPSLPNLATVLKDAGYEVVYKGKWHLSNGVEGGDGIYQHDDIARYGFDRWDPPDAGQDVKIENYGGGTAENDRRITDDAIAYLKHKRDNPGSKPFCLVVSLVNPHDVLGYPKNVGQDGYTPDDLVGSIDLPPTVGENLLTNHKPTCQHDLLLKLNGLGALSSPQKKREYLNFYGNLLKRVDGHLQRLLDVFSENQAGEDLRAASLVVRLSDHGEMGMCHSGMRQKTFNAYEETIRIPMIWSNPELFPSGRTSYDLISHVDFLPTVCTLLGVPNPAQYNFAGVDYSSLIIDENAPPVQDYVLFTFDDINAGQSTDGTEGNGIVDPPNRLQMIRTADYKYVRYFDGEGIALEQQEFYDLRPASDGGTDIDSATGLPVELRNLSLWAEARRTLLRQSTLATSAQKIKRTEMMQQLQTVTRARLQPRPLATPIKAEDVTIRTYSIENENNEIEERIELKFHSRWGSDYQLQRSPDLVAWNDVGDPVPGNNGPILMGDALSSDRAFYRVSASPPPAS